MSEEIRRMRQKYGTTAQWTSADPVLAVSEIGYEFLPAGGWLMKLGDGILVWSALPYMSGTVTRVIEDTSIARTLATTDMNATIDMNNASANTVTIPIDAAVDIPDDSEVDICRIGVGQTSIQAAAGVSLNGVSAGSIGTLAQFRVITLRKLSANAWIAYGAV